MVTTAELSVDEVVSTGAWVVSWVVDEDAGAMTTTEELSVDEVVATGACVLSGTGVSDVEAGLDDTATAASPSGVEDAVSVRTCELATTAELVGVTVISGIDVVEGVAVTVTTQVVMVYPTGH